MTMQSGNDALDRGRALLQQGDAQGAVELLEQAAREEPENGVALQYLGIARAQAGDPSGGIDALIAAAQLLPMSVAIQYNLGVALAQAGRVPEARAVLEKTLLLEPGNTRARDALQNLSGSGGASAAAGSAMAGSAAAAPGSEDLAAVGNNSGFAAAAAAAPPPPIFSSAGQGVEPGARSSGFADVGGGMRYEQATLSAAQIAAQRPSAGTRTLRGLGWGALYGQWWTLWVVFWDVVWGGLRGGANFSVTEVILEVVLLAFVFGFVGALTGLVIALMDANQEKGAIVGVVAGLLLMGGEYLMKNSGMVLVNIFFWFFTGRYVGALVANRVQRPVGS